MSVLTGTFVSHDKPFLYENRKFSSIEEHNEQIIERHNSLVLPEDTVYILGDCGFGTDYNKVIEYIQRMNGRKFLAIGNHDTDAKIAEYRKFNLFEDIQFAYRIRFKKYEYFLSHYPTIVSNKDDPKPVWNLHGHDHDSCIFHDYLTKNYDVCMEAHNCYPCLLDNIHNEIKERVRINV